jgi:hypothetical protein
MAGRQHGAAIKDAQIQYQRTQRENVEENPKIKQWNSW